MATLNNYLKGNLLLQKGQHNASIESTVKNFRLGQAIFQYCLQENLSTKDRVTLLFNFDFGKSRRKIYQDYADPDLLFADKQITQVSQRFFIVEYGLTLDQQESVEDLKNSLQNLIKEFSQMVLKKLSLPLVVFFQGLETLDLYLDAHDLYLWILEIIETYCQTLTEQTYFFIQSDAIDERGMKFLESIINCRVIIESHNEEKGMGLITMVLSKNSGFSYFEKYQLQLKKEKKLGVKIEKIGTDGDNVIPKQDEDLQKMFQTPFKLGLSETERKKKEDVLLPHMKVQSKIQYLEIFFLASENIWKDYLVELEQDEGQIDPEQDDDEDLDV